VNSPFPAFAATSPTHAIDSGVEDGFAASNTVARNPDLIGLACLRCDFQTDALDLPNGCPRCAEKGHASNLACLYQETAARRVLPMPYAHTPYLGGGNTPLVSLPKALVPASSSTHRAFFKLECANPTGSHKDRMAAVGVAHALAMGKREVIAASSGNAGVAVAAYAAAAGLPCEIAVTPTCSALYRAQIAQHGARVTECESSLARWTYVAERCADEAVYSLTNYALPAVGSPAVAIEGYKPIATEISRALGVAVDEIFVPVARGDLLWGLYLGFKWLIDVGHLSKMPRLVAVEPFPRLQKVLAGADYRSDFAGSTRQLSTSGSTVTFQALEAVRLSRGRVEVVDDNEAVAARDQLARVGFSFELCAAAAYVAYRRSQANDEHANRVTIIMATAHGGRDLAIG
jgi:threonine synthase